MSSGKYVYLRNRHNGWEHIDFAQSKMNIKKLWEESDEAQRKEMIALLVAHAPEL